MLQRLSVSNLAVIESGEAEFDNGLTIITGETGAGKSVLMGALQLVLGARADASSVRDGAKEARIEAEFSGVGGRVAAILEEKGLPPCEDGLLLVRRSISSSGGTRVWVNDASSTVQTLRALSSVLVDVHGPNDHQSLVEAAFQLRLLDAYASLTGYGPYAKAWEKLVALREERDRLSGDSSDVAAEIERLKFSVEELEKAALSVEDDTDLPQRHAAAAHATELLEEANAVTSALGGDDGASAMAALADVSQRFSRMARYHESAEAWREEADQLLVRVQELSRDVADSVSRLDVDPETLQALDERLSLVQRLKRKYSAASAEELIEMTAKKRARLNDLEGREERLAALDSEIAAAESDVAFAGAGLSVLRGKAAAKLGKAVTKELHDLGFLKAGFTVVLKKAEPSATGCDEVSFHFEPNPGESARPLSDIASTGEIARVMLAVKAVVASHDEIPTLVFDEIDSNIGGEVGRAVGEKLRTVAAHHQVIAITHLPQSAVYGARHLAVSKSVHGGRTRSEVKALEGDERVEEIARMLGGSSLTSVVTTHARELLAIAGEK